VCAEASTVLRAVAADFFFNDGIWRPLLIIVFGTYLGHFDHRNFRTFPTEKALCMIVHNINKHVLKVQNICGTIQGTLRHKGDGIHAFEIV
jgi:hypothetical protein